MDVTRPLQQRIVGVRIRNSEGVRGRLGAGTLLRNNAQELCFFFTQREWHDTGVVSAAKCEAALPGGLERLLKARGSSALILGAC